MEESITWQGAKLESDKKTFRGHRFYPDSIAFRNFPALFADRSIGAAGGHVSYQGNQLGVHGTHRLHGLCDIVSGPHKKRLCACPPRYDKKIQASACFDGKTGFHYPLPQERFGNFMVNAKPAFDHDRTCHRILVPVPF